MALDAVYYDADRPTEVIGTATERGRRWTATSAAPTD